MFIETIAIGASLLGVQEVVTFPTRDNGIVQADVYGEGEHGVVLAHGGRFTKESWSVQARALADSGFHVVSINFRGRGTSRGGSAGDDGVAFDVLAAVDYLRDLGLETVSVVGASFGGWASARAAIAAPELIHRLVLLAASPVERPERLTTPTLFILSKDDFSGNRVPRLPDIQAQYDATRGPKRLVLLEGSAHAQFLFDTNQADRLWTEIVHFLSEPEVPSSPRLFGSIRSGRGPWVFP